ncbi:MAG TPA: DUF2950 domain-containing protein [Candidatus Angelobacter sp.]|nr:DUF2950 domain-containing protein [Candidatus Angelobacter sp.]
MGVLRTLCWFLPLVAASLSSAALAAPPKTYATPEEAVQALVNAARTESVETVAGVLGSQSLSMLRSGDPVADKADLLHFAEMYDQAHSMLSPKENSQTLVLGDDEWPFPIPLVKGKTGWQFDDAAGQREILARRVGRNELNAIQVCLAYVDAQREYQQRNPDGSTPPHFADRLLSSQGKRDGLYWPSEPGQDESPLGPAVGGARQQGYALAGGKRTPYHGYYYRILTAQGSHAEGGAVDYLVEGNLANGFALVAYPAAWGNSGIMTFIVNQDGVVFQKDLGKNTASVAASMKRFDPDDSWKETTP